MNPLAWKVDHGRERLFVIVAVAAFCAFSAVVAGAYLYWQAGEREREIAAVVARLEALADSRKKAVRTWLAERRADAQTLAWDPDLIELCIEGTCPKGMDPGRLQAHLDNHLLSPGVLGTYLFTPSGTTLLLAEKESAACPEAEVRARLAAREGRFIMHDVHLCAEGVPKIGFLFPIFKRVDPQHRAEGAPVLGVVGLYLDPRVTLFPVLAGRGLYDRDEEVYLVRPEGATVRILSPVAGAAEDFDATPFPIETVGRLDRIGVGEAEGSGAFVDFRGQPVYAAARWISEAGWGLVAKIDRDAALAAWSRAAWMESGLLGTTFLCFLLGGLAVWRGWAGRRYRLLLEGLRDREERLRALAHGSEDVVFLKDMEGRYQLINAAAARILGVEPDQAVGRTARDFLAPRVAEMTEHHDRLAVQRGSPYHGEEVMSVHGVPHTYLSSRIPIRDSHGRLQGVAGVLRDITDRKAQEVELRHWAQTLGALYHVARNLTVATEAQGVHSCLLDDAVEAFRADAAALYLAEPEGRGLRLAEGRRLPAEFRDAYARMPRRIGPAAVKGGSQGVIAVTSCTSGPRRVARVGAAAGVESLVAIPLRSGGRLLGVLGLGFDGRREVKREVRDALEVLGHIAGVALDRSRALDALVVEAEVRQRAEERLRWLHGSTARLTGEALFQEVARALRQELDAELVLLSRVETTGMATPYVSLWEGEARALPPFPLIDTPCGEVVAEGTAVFYRDGLCHHFPRSTLVQGHSFRSYAGVPLHDARGDVIGVLCCYSSEPLVLGVVEQDLLHLYALRAAGEMERMLAESRLAEARRTLATLIENLPGAVYRSDCSAERSMEFISAGAEVVTGYPASTFLGDGGERLGDLIIAEDRGRAWRDIQAALAARQPYEVEYRIHDPDGNIRWIYDVGRAVRGTSSGAGAERLEGVLFDHTERRSLEAQLTHSQRMDALGRLAGGVAHEFNNLLTAISGYAELLAARLPAQDRAQKPVNEIVRATDRAADLTRQLLAFGRRQVMEPKLVDVNDISRDVARMVERLLGETVQCQLHLGEVPAVVRTDPGQVEQVLLNLLVNARDAMPGGGELVVRVMRERLAAPRKTPQGQVPEGDYVVLEVCDGGVGMESQVLSHIFEPFYTTKDKGENTGLGLATVYGVVTQSGGCVAVQSEPGVGTTVQVYWPAAPESLRTEPLAEPAGEGLGRVVVVVEDERAVRDMAAEHLREHGYRVLAYETATAAVAALGSVDHVDATVTDVVMAGMSGIELVEHLRQRWPVLPVVYISGHAGEALGQLDPGQPHTVFLQKPFRLGELDAAVRKVLASGAGEPRPLTDAADLTPER